MATNSKIEWTEATWNPVAGCTHASPGCDNCYAVKMTHRLEMMGQTAKYGGLTVLNKAGDRHFNGKIRTIPEALDTPLRRRKPTVYFVNSMSDLFHKDVPVEFIDRVFAVMALCPHHTFQILTKRPERMAEYFAADRGPFKFERDHTTTQDWVYMAVDDMPTLPDTAAAEQRELIICSPRHMNWPLPNVWLGTSVENQQYADERIPHLLRVPAAVRFLSCEPLLGAIDLRLLQGLACDMSAAAVESGAAYERIGIHWIIAGGESGPGARPMHPDWARSLRDQCQAAGVAFFFKQWGEWRPKLASIAGEPEPTANTRAWGTLQNTGKFWNQTSPWNGRQDTDSRDDGEVVIVRTGKHDAGRLLDGREWGEFPQVQP